MAGHKPDTVTVDAVPEPDTSVAGAGRHIVRVGVKGETVHVREMAVENAEGLRVLRRPEPRRPVVAAGGKVVAQRRKLDVPDGEDVPLVGDETGPGLEAPQAHRPVLAARQQHRLLRVEAHAVHRPEHGIFVVAINQPQRFCY